MELRLKIGPKDRGRRLTLDEFMASDSVNGYHYELIDGKLYVSPLPDLPHACVEDWIYSLLNRYSSENLAVINKVKNKARVFVPRRRAVTCPEPDVAAYRKFPLDRPLAERRWQDVSPILVVEVLSEDDPDKDLVRNVQLYLRVPSIREYWILDPLQEGHDRPHLIVRRRWGGRWRVRNVAPGETYTTRLLPGFELVVDPHR
jgi:Uma2 family endonuclease